MKNRTTAKDCVLSIAFSMALSCGVDQALGQEATTRHDQIAQHAAQAHAASRDRNFARAEEEWRKVIAYDPSSAQAFNNLGMVCYLQHKYAEAEESLRKALQLDHSLISAQVLLGAALGRQGRLEDAVVELDSVMKAQLSLSAEKTARVALHEVLFAQGNYDRALTVLEPMAKKYPQDVDVLYNMGQTHLQLATQNFQRIVQVSPESYRVHQILAESFTKQGQYREAIKEFRLALAQKPDLPGAHYQVGWLYWTNQHDAEGEKAALSEFEAELNINPFDAVSEYRLGRIYWKWKDLPNAHRHYQRAVDLDAKYVLPRIGLARVLEFQGDLQEAQKQLGLAAKLDPENATVHYRLAQLHKQLNDPTAAAKELQRFEGIRIHQGGAQTQLERLLQRQTEPESEDLGD